MNEKLRSILLGAMVAGLGAILTYVSQAATGADYGIYTPIVVAGLSVLTNIVRKLAEPTAH